MTKVIIIGAGPAGLCLAHELTKLGIKPTILEAGGTPGWSWKNMPEKIYLLSPWKRNCMNGTKVTLSNMHKLHSCKEFGDYLIDYSITNDISVKLSCRVEAVKKTFQDTFVLSTSKGEVAADIVVSAAGYFFNPKLPENLDIDATRCLHVHNFKSAKKLKRDYPDAKNILIIGGRISAGQTATELYTEGEYRVDISSRSTIDFAQAPWAQKIAFYFYYQFEDILMKFRPHSIGDTYPSMEGGKTKKLIREGKIGINPGLKRLSNGIAYFNNNKKKQYDLVIFSTGFSPVTSYLSVPDIEKSQLSGGLFRGFESAFQSNLFYLGIDNQINSRSRYLRGIREDAVHLAQLILKKTLNKKTQNNEI